MIDNFESSFEALQEKLEMAEIERKKREEAADLVMREMIRTARVYDRIQNAEYEMRDSPEIYDRQQTESDFSVHEVISPEQILDNSFRSLPTEGEEEESTQKENEENNKVTNNTSQLEKSEEDLFLASANDMMLHDLERSVKYQEKLEESLFSAKIEEEEQRQILSEYIRSEDLRERLQTAVYTSRIQECTEYDYLTYKGVPEPIYEPSSVTCVKSSAIEKQSKPTFLTNNAMDAVAALNKQGTEEIEEELNKIEQSNAKIQDMSELTEPVAAENTASLSDLVTKMETEIQKQIVTSTKLVQKRSQNV